ncbi:MAG: hypothetical protein P1U47_09930 [Zhongshania sp.]|uniref:hypothetical protein n=1 Tax=Zhongshania sp. TaxID=1971902 RepID=UPI00263286BD|nr:hypothetical protein [Zhongshania sp.]MDF1692682.1 hypothetical protein [Zhongshania sp.]
MICSDVDVLLDDYLDDGESENARVFTAHVATCRACSARLERHQQYLAVMKAARAPALESRRAATMVRLAASQSRLDQQRHRGMLLNTALAASLVAIAVIVGWRELPLEPSFPSAVQSMSPRVVELGEKLPNAAYLADEWAWQKNVTIVINVPEDMENARLVFNLPADVSLRGQEQLSQIDWSVSLKKGSNTIVLPLNVDSFAEFAGSVTLAASLIYIESKKDFELDIDLAPPQIRGQGAILKNAPRFTQLVNEFWRLV